MRVSLPIGFLVASILLPPSLPTPAVPSREEGARYLVITHDDFYQFILPLAEWKHKKGMMCKVVKLSEIGYTAPEIRDYVLDAWLNWQVPPEYLLLVGDTEFLPTHYSLTHTDNYYADMAGDYRAEIVVGRFSVDIPSHCETMVSKTLGYERTPYLQDPDWFENATLIVRDDYDPGDAIYYGDTWYIYDLLINAGYVRVDTLFRQHGANASDVVSAVDNGRTFVNYRGTGVVNWWEPFFVNPYSTNNGFKLPIVISGTCGTGSFHDDGYVCEDWMRAGTSGSPRGAVGFFGTNTVGSGQSLSQRRSAVDRGFFRSLFLDSAFTLGGACLGGKFNLYQLHHHQKEYEGWNLLGDPELNLWTSTPGTLDVSHPTVVPIGPGQFPVTITHNSNPVRDALVCLLMDTTVYEYGYTDAEGVVSLAIDPVREGSLQVTATAHNCLPYEGSASVVYPPGPYLVYLKHEIDDVSGGNGDGIVNPGESIELPLWVKNWGSEAGDGVTGVLTTADSHIVSIWDTLKDFGTVQPGDSAYTGADGYNFTVSGSTPDEYVIGFDLTCKDANDSTWRSGFLVPVSAPVLSYLSCTVADPPPGGNGNGVAEPGETVDIEVTLQNTGHAGAVDVQADLGTADPWVVIDSAHAGYGDIPSGGTETSSPPYNVSIDPGCPAPHFPVFTLSITASGGYSATDSFTIVVGGTGFFDDMEEGVGDWHHYTATPGYTDEWHLTNYRSHSPTHSWKCGSYYDPGHYDYNDDACLETPDIILASGSFLEFWHWMAAATCSANVAWDGGIVQVSTDSGASWELIEPVGGYPYILQNFPTHPFPGLPCYSGSTLVWTHEQFDLSAYSGSVRIRFRFGSDGYMTAEGWYVDDVWVGEPTGIEEEEAGSRHQASGIRLMQNQPNPFTHFTSIKLQVKSEKSKVSLRVYDLSGRLVRTLVDEHKQAGHYSVSWDGHDETGETVPAGIYFYRLESGELVSTRKMVVLR